MRRGKNDQKNLFEEIKAENFPSLGKEADTHIQEAQRAPTKMIPKTPTTRHIIIKMITFRVRAREKQHITYNGNTIRLSADFSA